MTNLTVIKPTSEQLPETLDKIEYAIAKAETIDEAKKTCALIDAAFAYANSYFKGQKDLVSRAKQLKLRAERRLGEILQAMPKAAGVKMAGRDSFGGTKTEPPKNAPTLAEIGIDKKTSARAQKLAALPDETFAEIEAGEITVAQAIAPKPKSHTPAPVEEPKDDGPSAEELAADEAAARADEDILARLLDSDDALATAHAEIKRLNAVVAGLQQRVNGLLNEKSEAIKLAKREQNKVNRLQKELDQLRKVAA